jgi:alanine racemase
MGVVKANAYGHGAIEISRALLDSGADYLAVASLDEAIELRRATITSPLLILGYVNPSRVEEILKYDLTQTVYEESLANALSDAAVKSGKRVRIHVKIDTGMTRIGVNLNEAKNFILKIAKLPNIELEGMFTHLATADESDGSYTHMQFERYLCLAEELKHNGLEIPIKHVCNSAGAINYPHMHLDMIRPGISLYGCYPSAEVSRDKIDLKPVMSLKTEVIRVNEVQPGVRISYGGIFTTKRKSRIATLPVGYADGFNRTLTGKASVLINGQYAPIVGKICMDQCMADITDLSDRVRIGDEVVLFGKQKENEILTDDLASSIGTINYEITCNVARRIPRYYIKDGKFTGIENYLLG